jgi:hypothetical protein
MMVDPADDSTFWYTGEYSTASGSHGNFATRILSFNLCGDTAWPYAFAGNDTVVPNVVFFNTQGEADNYSSIFWTTSGDGNFTSNYAENVTYLRGPGDLDSGQVTLTMHLTGYYPGIDTSDSMVLYLQPTGSEDSESGKISIKMYPNPTSDIITIEADLLQLKPLILKIFSESGKLIFTGKYSSDNGCYKQQFDLTYLPAGIYVVRLVAGSKAVNRKMVKL